MTALTPADTNVRILSHGGYISALFETSLARLDHSIRHQYEDLFLRGEFHAYVLCILIIG